MFWGISGWYKARRMAENPADGADLTLATLRHQAREANVKSKAPLETNSYEWSF
jgi:hypothetical protein